MLELVYLPGMHGIQDEDPDIPLYDPPTHCVQPDAPLLPATLNVPAGHAVHLSRPNVTVYFPESQMEQFVASVSLEKDPALQLLQEYLFTYTPPGLHMHLSNPVSLVYDVLLQAVHTVAVELE